MSRRAAVPLHVPQERLSAIGPKGHETGLTGTAGRNPRFWERREVKFLRATRQELSIASRS